MKYLFKTHNIYKATTTIFNFFITCIKIKTVDKYLKIEHLKSIAPYTKLTSIYRHYSNEPSISLHLSTTEI